IAFRHDNYSEALNYLISAAEGLPSNPLVYYHLGEVYMKLGRISDARETLSRAIELSEDREFPQIDRARELLNAPSRGD
ncbi:MAG: tetratricopeptide repeat protein, partial [Hyphomicrobiales bacterium]